jgi:hypothetical protein
MARPIRRKSLDLRGVDRRFSSFIDASFLRRSVPSICRFPRAPRLQSPVKLDQLDLIAGSPDDRRRFLRHRIGDPRVIRLIQKWLKAGVPNNSSLGSVRQTRPYSWPRFRNAKLVDAYGFGHRGARRPQAPVSD